VQSWSARFSGDLKAGPSGICKKSGVGILVDPHFLDGGRRDTRPVGFDTVNDQRDAVGRDGVVVQEAGECGDVVLIENGNAIEGGKRFPVKVTGIVASLNAGAAIVRV
jgi:hypothetical protein